MIKFQIQDIVKGGVSSVTNHFSRVVDRMVNYRRLIAAYSLASCFMLAPMHTQQEATGGEIPKGGVTTRTGSKSSREISGNEVLTSNQSDLVLS